MPELAIGTDEWWEARKRARAAATKERSDEHFNSGDAIPDIDFSVDCPICGDPLDCDDGFYCRVCFVTWPRDGYGHGAERHAP